MKNIRNNVFETNSSSSHSISICSEEDYNRWKKGEMIFDAEDEILVEVPSVTDDMFESGTYQTFERFEESFGDEFITKKFTTKSGEGVIAFGGEKYDC